MPLHARPVSAGSFLFVSRPPRASFSSPRLDESGTFSHAKKILEDVLTQVLYPAVVDRAIDHAAVFIIGGPGARAQGQGTRGT